MKRGKISLHEGMTYLSVLSNKHYDSCLVEILKNLKGKKICFVTLNKGAKSLEVALKKRGVDTKDILFVDTVSKGLGNNEEKENVLYLSSPAALTEISLAIGEVSKTKQFNTVLFDSISTLSIYDIKQRTAQRFVTSLIDKAKVNGQLGVFTCLKADFAGPLAQKSCMMVDEVLQVGDSWKYQPKIRGSIQAGVLGLALVSTVAGLYNAPGLGFSSGNHLSAAAVTDVSASGGASVFSALLFFAIAILGFFFIARRNTNLGALPESELQKIQPKEVNEVHLKEKLKEKIQKWLQS